jgi:hypothetical protein
MSNSPERSDFPELSDITIPIPEPFAISGAGDWWAIGIGRLGMILRHAEDPTVLRWIGQVVKFVPQADYFAAGTVTRLLLKQGIEGANWQCQAGFYI